MMYLKKTFPKPISSAKIPLIPCSYSIASQFRPLSWYSLSWAIRLRGWPMVRGPCKEVGFWKLSSSESTAFPVSAIYHHKNDITHDRLMGLWRNLHQFLNLQVPRVYVLELSLTESLRLSFFPVPLVCQILLHEFSHELTLPGHYIGHADASLCDPLFKVLIWVVQEFV